jgi:transcription initiation factor TFIIE subunit beta
VRNYVRGHSTTIKGLAYKDVKEALPKDGNQILENLEKAGHVLIMRALGGMFKDVPLPKLGEKNVHGLYLTEAGTSGGQTSRFKVIFWDDMKERDKVGKRVDQGELKGPIPSEIHS